MQRLQVDLDEADSVQVLHQQMDQASINASRVNPNDPNDQAKRQAAIEEARQKSDALKQAVFPNGFLLRAKVYSSLSHMAVLYVDVPDFESLIAILSDPRVTQVSRGQYAQMSGT